jgi:ribose 5-phosphate isomerase A
MVVGLGSGSTAAPRASHAGGIVGHGLFIGLTSERVVAGPSGIEHRRPA